MGERQAAVGRVGNAVWRSWLAGLLAVALGGCAATVPAPAAEANPWVGKSRKEVVQELGEPTQVIPSATGSKMMIYSEPDQPHYVFEIGPDDKVSQATEVE